MNFYAGDGRVASGLELLADAGVAVGGGCGEVQAHGSRFGDPAAACSEGGEQCGGTEVVGSDNGVRQTDLSGEVRIAVADRGAPPAAGDVGERSPAS